MITIRKEGSLKLIYLSIAVLIILLAACNSKTPTETPPQVETGEPVEAEATSVVQLDPGDLKPALSGDPPLATSTGLQYIILDEGEGLAPQSGDLVMVHYVGSLADGTVYDNSYDRDQPLIFSLGTGEVIPGWDEGMELLRPGGKARLIIPPELAYGPRGSGQVIPADATLYLEVELISVDPGGGFVAPAEVIEADYIITESGLQYYDFEVGRGDVPQPGQTVTVHYTGWFEDESMFDSSRLREEPFTFSIGEGGVIAGWREGVSSMRLGGKRQLIIPPELAYGEQGAGGGAIPPDTTLIFEIELLTID